MADLQDDGCGEDQTISCTEASTEGTENGSGIAGCVEGFDEFGRDLELLKWTPLDASNLTPEQLEICQELLRHGDISWLLHPGQKLLLDWLEDRDAPVICVARQWGKTLMLTAVCIVHCLRNAKHNVIFIAPYALQGENNLLPKINFIFSFLPDDCVPTQRGLTWRFNNGSTFRITGVSAGKGTRIRGTTADLVVMDEVRDMTDLQETIETAIQPMLLTRNGKIIMISTPPDSPAHPFTQKYIIEAIKTNNFYSATYKTNPMISTKTLRKLITETHPNSENDPVFRREYLADYEVADNNKKVIREWNSNANDAFFVDYKLPDYKVRPYTLLDYGHTDPCGILVGFYDFKNAVFVVMQEHFEAKMNTAEVAMKIIELEAKLKEDVKDLSDWVRIMDIDPSLMNDLRSSYNLRFEPARKVPSNLFMLNQIRVAFAEGRIRVHENCIQLRFQLSTGIFNKSGADYVRTARGGHLDLLDALKYGVLNIRWHEREVIEEAKLGRNQMVVGFRKPASSFGSGVINRPI